MSDMIQDDMIYANDKHISFAFVVSQCKNQKSSRQRLKTD